LAAVEAGADAIGLVFYPPSPRSVSVEQAVDIVQNLPPFVTKVGLFVNEKRPTIAEIIGRVGLDLLQFHGDESAAECQGYDRPYMKALRMKPDLDLMAMKTHYFDAAGLLLDTYQKGVPGGTGAAFNWGLIPPSLAGEIVLAGGLSVANIAAAIQQVRPYAVDVSGGVEQEKGIKDKAKIEAFIHSVNKAALLGGSPVE